MSWNNKTSYTFTKNLRWFSSSTSKYFIPLIGSLSENASGSDSAVNFCPSNSGKITQISFDFDLDTGSTVLTLEDGTAGIIGTKTFAGSDSLMVFNFPEDLDSGTSLFNGSDRIRIGINVTDPSNSVRCVVTFEIDL